MSKFGVWNIVSSHYNTLRNYRTEKIEFSSVFVDLFLPFLIGLGITYFGIVILRAELFDLIFMFSILSILPINMMIFLHGILNEERMKGSADQKKIRLATETISNIQFCLLTSLSIVIVGLIMFISSPVSFFNYIDIAGSFLVYYLMFVFIITLFMVLKRLHSVSRF